MSSRSLINRTFSKGCGWPPAQTADAQTYRDSPSYTEERGVIRKLCCIAITASIQALTLSRYFRRFTLSLAFLPLSRYSTSLDSTYDYNRAQHAWDERWHHLLARDPEFLWNVFWSPQADVIVIKLHRQLQLVHVPVPCEAVRKRLVTIRAHTHDEEDAVRISPL